MNRIVVAFDGSEHARGALEAAAELAREGTTIKVVSAIALPTTGTHGSAGADPAETEERNRELPEASQFFAARGIDVETVEGYGDAADVIIDEAQKDGANLIMVGTRGLNFAQQLILGSVSTKVAHHATCSVLLAR